MGFTSSCMKGAIFWGWGRENSLESMVKICIENIVENFVRKKENYEGFGLC